MRKRLPTKEEHSKKKDREQPFICYECKKLGHFRSECPQLKKVPKKYKKKAMVDLRTIIFFFLTSSS